MTDIQSGLQFHFMAKPVGALCNLNCKYCYYLSKQKYFTKKSVKTYSSIDNREENQENTFTKSKWLMSDELLECFIDQYINEQDRTEINFTWQGGEPTLAGIEFFEKIINLQKNIVHQVKV